MGESTDLIIDPNRLENEFKFIENVNILLE